LFPCVQPPHHQYKAAGVPGAESVHLGRIKFIRSSTCCRVMHVSLLFSLSLCFARCRPPNRHSAMFFRPSQGVDWMCDRLCFNKQSYASVCCCIYAVCRFAAIGASAALNEVPKEGRAGPGPPRPPARPGASRAAFFCRLLETNAPRPNERSFFFCVPLSLSPLPAASCLWLAFVCARGGLRRLVSPCCLARQHAASGGWWTGRTGSELQIKRTEATGATRDRADSETKGRQQVAQQVMAQQAIAQLAASPFGCACGAARVRVRGD
jgi:hypothetical protein